MYRGFKASARHSRRLGLGLILATLALVLWAGWSRHAQRQARRELDLAMQDMAAGRQALARKRLVEATGSWALQDEALYQLGLCDEARHHFDDALSTWERIPRRSPFTAKATIARARVLANSGRFAAAEELLTSLPRPSGPEGSLVRQGLELLWRIEGATTRSFP